MKTTPFQMVLARIHRWLLPGALLVVLLGCSGDSGYKTVDFEDTIPAVSPDPRQTDDRHLRVAVAAMISPKETLIYYRQLLAYLGGQLGYDTRLVQRRTYAEINELFPKKQIELAFVCTGPYAMDRDRFGFEGLATPIIRERPYYQSYLIVNKNSAFSSLEGLRGSRFAFTDPDSNTGSLVPHFWLNELSERPASFFKSISYTYSHDNSIMAVARSLVDAAAVDGHKWEYFNLRNPQHTARTRVIKKSEPFGSPPLVAARSMAPALKHSIRKVLFSMHEDPDGKLILDELLIDRFEPPEDEWYEPVREMYRKIHFVDKADAQNPATQNP
ncbi:MAG: phosphate/phosphite/phosphonate ABC transporter substrate-binding protein [Desulfobacterales bacterium]